MGQLTNQLRSQNLIHIKCLSINISIEKSLAFGLDNIFHFSGVCYFVCQNYRLLNMHGFVRCSWMRCELAIILVDALMFICSRCVIVWCCRPLRRLMFCYQLFVPLLMLHLTRSSFQLFLTCLFKNFFTFEGKGSNFKTPRFNTFQTVFLVCNKVGIPSSFIWKTRSI